jgi:hypothetical protein
MGKGSVADTSTLIFELDDGNSMTHDILSIQISKNIISNFLLFNGGGSYAASCEHA